MKICRQSINAAVLYQILVITAAVTWGKSQASFCQSLSGDTWICPVAWGHPVSLSETGGSLFGYPAVTTE